jgi:DNA replication protein DnaC
MILKEILEQCQNRRAKAQMLAEYNYKIALDNEEFFQAEKAYRNLNFEYGKNPNEQTLSKVNDINKTRKQILEKLGLRISPQYQCTTCQDTGYKNGKLCLCIKQEVSKRISDICAIPKNIRCDFEQCDLSVFSNELQRKIMESTYEKMKDYCKKFPDTPINSIIFSGSTGTGKTYLISAMASELSMSGFDVFFTTAFGLNNIFLKSHTAKIEEKSQYIEPLLKCDLLIIDDLGTEPMYRNVSNEYLYTIINERKINKQHTLISTNLNQDEILTRYGERIFSRLNNKADSLFLSLEGSDIRLNKKK